MVLSPTRQRLVDEQGISPQDVMRLVRMGKRRAAHAEHECNGDPYPGVDADDKNVCAECWGFLVEQDQNDMLAVASKYNLKVDFGVGLYPCLVDSAGRYIHIPYEE